MVSRIVSHVHGLVKREGAEQYVLYSLLSFAASVSLTRLFLEFTGYPQLGTSTLHIAHVLWGGLLLFLSSLLPLVLANRWVYTAGGILSGIGVGLFIDEVGKFITQTNDYFYPPAAPIIYSFFLLVVLLYLRVRRPPRFDSRAELYRALDALQEVLDHDLDRRERETLKRRLQLVGADAKHPNLAALAQALINFIESESLELAPVRPSLPERIEMRFNAALERWLNRRRLKWSLVAGLTIAGSGALAQLTILLPNSPSVRDVLALLVGHGDRVSANVVFLYTVRLVLEGMVGCALLLATVLLARYREDWGTVLGYFGLLVALTVLDLLVFYFSQFSAILTALGQFALLMGLILYRQRYLITSNELDGQPSTGPT